MKDVDIEIIPYGKENKISREELIKILKPNFANQNFVNQNPKKVANQIIGKFISNLRKEYIILSDTETGGYWRPNTKKELINFIREHNSIHLAEAKLVQIAWNEIDKLGGI